MSNTSTSSTSVSSSTSAPGATSSTPASTQPPPQSSSLYLFTFLATLLLLLAVSCAIVIRSFILRRRFRRRIEEAIAAGVLIPGALDDGPGGGMGRGRRRDFGEKPKLWEVWVDEHGQVHDGPHEGSSDGDDFGKGEGKWEEILPVSATILSSNAPKPIPLPVDGSTVSLPTSERQDAHRIFISRLLGRRPFTTSSPSPTQSPPQDQNQSAPELNSDITGYPPSILSKDRGKEEERLQVSVLISMPNPNARRSYGSDAGGAGSDVSVKGKGKGPGFEDVDVDGETEIPDVVFGVAEVGFRS